MIFRLISLCPQKVTGQQENFFPIVHLLASRRDSTSGTLGLLALLSRKDRFPTWWFLSRSSTQVHGGEDMAVQLMFVSSTSTPPARRQGSCLFEARERNAPSSVPFRPMFPGRLSLLSRLHAVWEAVLARCELWAPLKVP